MFLFVQLYFIFNEAVSILFQIKKQFFKESSLNRQRLSLF